MGPNKEISIILPCLNEEKAIGSCLLEITKIISLNSLDAEIVVVDNDSEDKTANIVLEYQKKNQNIILVKEKRRGYGSAYLRGFKEAKGKYIFMADADNSYDFKEIPNFINKLKNENFDLVVGNRFSGMMNKKSMPWLHKYIGNPVLSYLVRLFFKIKIHDIHCGARAISKEALEKITVYTAGMEFASELIIKAAKGNLKITEIPIEYRERIGESKLNSLSDGWRHLRFILLYSPNFLFLIPGILLFFIGLIFLIIFYFSNPQIWGIQLYVHPMFLFAIMIMIGYQIIFFAGFSRVYAVTHLGDKDKLVESLFKKITVEKAGIFGIIIVSLGLIIYLYIISKWINSGLGSINQIKNSIVALTLIVLGIQTLFSAFMMSILGIKEK
jgi:glycosyltransferase involved in cell wall biosynthesis